MNIPNRAGNEIAAGRSSSSVFWTGGRRQWGGQGSAPLPRTEKTSDGRDGAPRSAGCRVGDERGAATGKVGTVRARCCSPRRGDCGGLRGASALSRARGPVCVGTGSPLLTYCVTAALDARKRGKLPANPRSPRRGSFRRRRRSASRPYRRPSVVAAGLTPPAASWLPSGPQAAVPCRWATGPPLCWRRSRLPVRRGARRHELAPPQQLPAHHLVVAVKLGRDSHSVADAICVFSEQHSDLHRVERFPALAPGSRPAVPCQRRPRGYGR